jgi:hypothetical protein
MFVAAPTISCDIKPSSLLGPKTPTPLVLLRSAALVENAPTHAIHQHSALEMINRMIPLSLSLSLRHTSGPEIEYLYPPDHIAMRS